MGLEYLKAKGIYIYILKLWYTLSKLVYQAIYHGKINIYYGYNPCETVLFIVINVLLSIYTYAIFVVKM